ncbi:hypothetical protein ACN27E_20990 [Mycobacterium sp. WMMD1722]|uniref:hypothetical protein n=1 Tax=Mycobacterium sp. WMMD1722 TaxID=3404117 RepID=UPI003BF4EF0C
MPKIGCALILTAGLLLTLAPAASAQLEQPSPPPYIPGDVDPQPGSFSYPYNVIVVPPPAAVDARGVNITTNVDPSSQAIGMPGSELGNSPPPANSLTGSNVLYGVEAGIASYQSEQAPLPTVNITAGAPVTGSLEDPAGKPPSNPVATEATAPTTAPGYPPPILETVDPDHSSTH